MNELLLHPKMTEFKTTMLSKRGLTPKVRDYIIYFR